MMGNEALAGGQVSLYADFVLAPQLDLTNRTTMLFAIAEQRLDELANDLAHRITRMFVVRASIQLSHLARLPVLVSHS